MAEYGSGIFYSRANGRQNSPTFSQLGYFSLPPALDVGPPIEASACKSESEGSKDVILLAEFSEIEGPIPLLTIPQNNNHDLDLNEFVVHLMSTDYQNMGNSEFQIHEDTCLLKEDCERGCYTYAHYFTLYDVHARGFVRPMCLAYISQEREKLKRYFKAIQKDFSKATKYLRVRNLNLFSEEMKNRIEDLRFTKERFIKSQKYFLPEEGKHILPKSEVMKEKKRERKSKRKRTTNLSNEECHPPKAAHELTHESSSERVVYKMDKTAARHSAMLSRSPPFQFDSFHNLSSYSDLPFARLPPSSISCNEAGRLLSSSAPQNTIFVKYGSSTLPLRSSLPDTLRVTSHLKPQYCNSQMTLAHCDSLSKDSPKEVLFETSLSSTSSSSTVKPSQDLKSPYGPEHSPSGVLEESFTNSDEVSTLQHTSLEALAVQLLDCQYILQVIDNYLESSETVRELDSFLDEIKNSPQSPLYAVMEDLGLLGRQCSEPEAIAKPTLFVISLMKRSFRTIRPVRSLCNTGYIACIAKLLNTFQKFSKSNLTLLFEDLDRDLYENPFGSLFMGIIPIIRIGDKSESTAIVPPLQRFSLGDARWNEDLVRLMRLEPSQASTPDSEYSDAQENLDREANVALADDCLEVFTTAPTPTMFQGGDEQRNDLPTHEASLVKSQSVAIKASSHPTTPIRSTSSDSSWASSNSRDMNLLEGMESEMEEGEEEEVMSNANDRSVVRLFRYDVAHRMEMGRVHRMSAVIQQFGGVSQCIVHSILSGKPMVVAGPEYLRSVVILYTKTLSTILPVKPNDFPPILKWHTGTITPHHLKMYKIIGICIPERLHVQDLMSNATLNQVTVLNIETGHISGVAYSGGLLYKADQLSRRKFRSDASLQAALQSTLISLGMKVFLHFHLLRTTSRTSNEILKGIGIPRGDWPMIQYLTQMVQEQLTEADIILI